MNNQINLITEWNLHEKKYNEEWCHLLICWIIRRTRVFRQRNKRKSSVLIYHYKKESFQKGNAFIYDVYLYDFEFFVFRWKRQVCWFVETLLRFDGAIGVDRCVVSALDTPPDDEKQSLLAEPTAATRHRNGRAAALVFIGGKKSDDAEVVFSENKTTRDPAPCSVEPLTSSAIDSIGEQRPYYNHSVHNILLLCLSSISTVLLDQFMQIT